MNPIEEETTDNQPDYPILLSPERIENASVNRLLAEMEEQLMRRMDTALTCNARQENEQEENSSSSHNQRRLLAHRGYHSTTDDITSGELFEYFPPDRGDDFDQETRWRRQCLVTAFSHRIASTRPPPKLKIPHLESYQGKLNMADHIAYFESTTSL